MTLLENIKAASIKARRNRDPLAVFLVTLYSEAAMIGKNKRNGDSTDEEVISIIKKFKAGAETILETAKTQSISESVIKQSNIEIGILNQFLPTMMDDDELKTEIEKFVGSLSDRSMKQMGTVMNHLKTTFPGLYDGALAAKLIKTYLS
ncbi:MAG: GatB/YqeY domain-containing protein [Nitrososphaeraceae archaeon]